MILPDFVTLLKELENYSNHVSINISLLRSEANGILGKRKKPDNNVEVVSSDAAAFVKKLKQQKGKGIVIFGDGEFAKALFEADLIDEIVLNIQPVLLGSGIPLFHEMSKQIDLKAQLPALKRRWCGGYLPRKALTSIRTEQYTSMYFFAA